MRRSVYLLEIHLNEQGLRGSWLYGDFFVGAIMIFSLDAEIVGSSVFLPRSSHGVLHRIVGWRSA